MLLTKIGAIALVSLFVLPAFSSSFIRIVGLQYGDNAAFEYDIVSLGQSVQGDRVVNVSSTTSTLFSVDVYGVNTTASIGQVVYRETVTVLNSSTLVTPSVFNGKTAIFDPYDNRTYLGQIGFYPFTYTSLPAGKATKLNVSVPFSGFRGVNQTYNVVATVSATVTRSSKVINVAFSVKSDPKETPWHGNWNYSASTGWLINGSLSVNFLQTPRILKYKMTALSHNGPVDTSLLQTTIAVVAAIAVGGFGIYQYSNRKSKKEAKTERMREKMGRHK